MIIVAFLKKNYEKLILGVLLLIFIGLLINLGILVRETREISVAERKDVKQLRANYEKVAKKISAEEALKTYNKWEKKKPGSFRDAKEAKAAKDFSGDFIIPAPLTICPSCRRAIPVSDFKITTGDGLRHCSLRGHVLNPPMELVIEDKGKDTDKDGIPDDYENSYQKLGYQYNAQDGRDAALDFDNDGYTNLEEYLCDTDPLNPMIAPRKKGPGGKLNGRLPYWKLLSCTSVARRSYTFEVRSINKNNVTLRIFEMRKDSTGRTSRRQRNIVCKAGDNFRSLNENMKILRIENRKQAKAVLNNYVLIVKDLFTGDELVAERLKKVVSPYPRGILVFRDKRSTPRQVKTGDKVVYGNVAVSGQDVYTVSKVDVDGRKVHLKDSSGKEVVVERQMKINSILAEKRREKTIRNSGGPKESQRIRR